VLDHGETIAQGSFDDVSNDPMVVEAYLGRPVQEAS
jgi:ABC-type branched-subunit amino acid transport system ATPase component